MEHSSLMGVEAKDRISVIIDEREPHAVMRPMLERCGCSAIEIRRLPLGDYLVNDSLLETDLNPHLTTSLTARCRRADANAIRRLYR